MLGVDLNATRTERESTLESGTVELFYTDELIERRGSCIDDSLTRLQTHLAAPANRSLDQLCDELVATMLSPDAEDDVATPRQDKRNVPPPDLRHPARGAARCLEVTCIRTRSVAGLSLYRHLSVMVLWTVKGFERGKIGADRVEGLAGDVALDTANRLAFGQAAGLAPFDVGAGVGAVTQP